MIELETLLKINNKLFIIGILSDISIAQIVALPV